MAKEKRPATLEYIKNKVIVAEKKLAKTENQLARLKKSRNRIYEILEKLHAKRVALLERDLQKENVSDNRVVP